MLAGNNDSLAHSRMLAKNGLDFAKFDAKPANLYLLIDSVEVLDVAIRQIARAIAGLV